MLALPALRDADLPGLSRGWSIMQVPTDDVVSYLRLPIAVLEISLLADALEAVYGKGLTLETDGTWLVIRRPVTTPAAP